MTTIKPGTNGLPASFGIPVEILRDMFGQHPDGVLTSPAIGSSTR